MIDTDIHSGNYLPFWRRIAYLFVFFTITPIALIAGFVSLYSINNDNKEAVLAASTQYDDNYGVQLYASLPSQFSSISGEVINKDARIELVRQFLDKYKSPMKPYAEYIINTSDKYQLDYRLTTAIAMKESGLGKAMPSEDCHNAWGFGIHSEGTLCFDNWEEGIETVSKGLKENYIDLGYETPEEMMQKYTPLSKGSWAEGVIFYMDKMI